MPLPPFYRVFALFVRVYTKPILDRVKTNHLWNFGEPEGLNKYFLKLGRKKYKLDLWVNLKFMNMSTDCELFMKDIPDGLALEKGITFFYDILFFVIVMTISGHEVFKTYKKSKNKRAMQHDEVQEIESLMQDVDAKIKRIRERRAELNSHLEARLEKFKNSLQNVIEEVKECSQSDATISQMALEINNSQKELQAEILKVKGIAPHKH